MQVKDSIFICASVDTPIGIEYHLQVPLNMIRHNKAIIIYGELTLVWMEKKERENASNLHHLIHCCSVYNV